MSKRSVLRTVSTHANADADAAINVQLVKNTELDKEVHSCDMTYGSSTNDQATVGWDRIILWNVLGRVKEVAQSSNESHKLFVAFFLRETGLKCCSATGLGRLIAP